MAYSANLKLVVGDTLPELTITLKDSNTAASGQTLDPRKMQILLHRLILQAEQ